MKRGVSLSVSAWLELPRETRNGALYKAMEKSGQQHDPTVTVKHNIDPARSIPFRWK